MVARYYSNTSVATTLTSLVSDSTTTIPVDSVSGFPSTPFTGILDPGTADEELVEVTAVAGNNLTVTRGIDGTPATPHAISAGFVHGVSARDWREPMEHIDDTTSVHGIANTAALVLLTGAQTLTGKTLTSPTINGGTIGGATLTTPTIASFVNATHTHEDDASGGEIGGGGGSGSSVVYKRTGTDTEAITGDAGTDGSTPLTMGTLTHSVGNTTWATANGNKRIVLPTDIATGYWHVSAGTTADGEGANNVLGIAIYHQDLGLIASSAGGSDGAVSVSVRRLCASTDFVSSAGKWIEARLLCDNVSDGSWFTENNFIALHRIA